MSDAERIKFWTQHAINSEADREYLAASVQAQISMALSLERIAEALAKTQWGKGLEPLLERQMFAEQFNAPEHHLAASPKHGCSHSNLSLYSDARLCRDCGEILPLPPPASPVGDAPITNKLRPDVLTVNTAAAVVADPFTGVCNRCGWEFKHMAHDEKYGSHKYEPSPYKNLAEWRKANNVSQVLPNVE